MTRKATREEVLTALAASSRIAFIRHADGLAAVNSIKEMMLDLDRQRGDMFEVAMWEDILKVDGDDLYYAYMVDNQSIVIPETIDAIRALSGKEKDGSVSIEKTNRSMGITRNFLSRE